VDSESCSKVEGTFCNSRILAGGLAALIPVFLISATIAVGKQGNNAQPEAAQRAFAANCAGCHGLDGKGGERAPDIVTRPSVRQLSDSALLKIVQKGVPRTSMPSFSHLGDTVLRSLTAYLRTLQGDRMTAALPGDARQGKELFRGKGGCSGCHMVRGQGGFFASDLTSYAIGRAPDKIRDAIVFPNRDLAPSKRAVVATLRNGKTVEGIARNEDNFSIQLLTQDGVLHLLPKSALSSLSYRSESPMPADYGTRLSAAELKDLVNYLSSIAEKDAKQQTKEDDPD
jgi:cytochrome c oxidase cbb3-type subunit III